MPYPSEHAARQQEPEKYKRFRRENAKFGAGIDVIWGIKENGDTEIQTIRFNAKKFTVAEANAWLEQHNFKKVNEPAVNKEQTIDSISYAVLLEATTSKEERMLRNVKLLGTQSQNGYKYSAQALESVAHLAKDKPVYFDHIGNQARSARDIIGKVIEARVVNDEVRGDVLIFETAWQQVSELAESKIENVGMSMHAGMDDKFVKAFKKSNLVENISIVRSFDIVTDPATSKTFFEQSDPDIADMMDFGDITDTTAIRKIYALMRGMMANKAITRKETIRRIDKVLMAAKKKFGDIDKLDDTESTDNKKESRQEVKSMEYETLKEALKDVTEGDLRAERGDLIETVLKPIQEQVSQLTEQNKTLVRKIAEFDEKERKTKVTDDVEKMLKESQLPERAITEAFKTQLIEAVDDETRKALINDRLCAVTLKEGVSGNGEQKDGKELNERTTIGGFSKKDIVDAAKQISR